MAGALSVLSIFFCDYMALDFTLLWKLRLLCRYAKEELDQLPKVYTTLSKEMMNFSFPNEVRSVTLGLRNKHDLKNKIVKSASVPKVS